MTCAKALLKHKLRQLGQKPATLSWQGWALAVGFHRDVRRACSGELQLLTECQMAARSPEWRLARNSLEFHTGAEAAAGRRHHRGSRAVTPARCCPALPRACPAPAWVCWAGMSLREGTRQREFQQGWCISLCFSVDESLTTLHRPVAPANNAQNHRC